MFATRPKPLETVHTHEPTNLPRTSGLLAAALLTIAVSQSADAQITGHYPNGAEGINNATLPPKGLFFKDYNIFYHADSFRSPGGADVAGDFSVTAYVNAPRVFYFPGIKVLGGDAGFDLAIPFVHTEVTLAGTTFRETGIGDILPEFLIGWHKEKYHLAAGVGLFVPTGDFAATQPASPGKGFWTPMIPLGITVYLNEEKTLNFSTAHRFEFHTSQRQTGITPGINWNSEIGLTKTLRPGLDIGLVGYTSVQLTEDSGPRTTRDQVLSIGPEINWFWAKHKLHFAARYYREFAVRDRFQGGTGMLVVTKIF